MKNKYLEGLIKEQLDDNQKTVRFTGLRYEGNCVGFNIDNIDLKYYVCKDIAKRRIYETINRYIIK